MTVGGEDKPAAVRASVRGSGGKERGRGGAPAREGPRSVGRSLDILNAISLSPLGFTLAEVTAALKAPKSSLLNLLKGLSAKGYVGMVDGRYVLGAAAYDLATNISSNIVFPTSLLPTLERLADQTGETSAIADLVGDGRQISFLAVADGTRAIRLGVRRGDLAPTHLVVVGQVLLAYLPQDRQDQIISSLELNRAEGDTKASLTAKLRAIRSQGYAAGAGGSFDETMGVAAPVFDQSSEVRCAVAVGGPIARVRAAETDLLREVMAAAKEMSRILGNRGP